ncbi:MAG: hypothetical protein E6Q88_05195 [Lysobacteraceae bacterium]|nr:MAG: hypothetical protein E6Q88_05195 [Xanthomonadaceae bacterium]
MPSAILRILSLLLVCLVACLRAAPVEARTMRATVRHIDTGLATMRDVRVELDWPADAIRGALRLRIGALVAPELGYRFHDLDWRCPLSRDGQGGWRCDGELRSADASLRLSIDLGTAFTDVRLHKGRARLEVHRQAATPDDTRIDLVDVPLVWAQALLAQAWNEGRLKSGSIDGRLMVQAPRAGPLRMTGPLMLSGAALETPDASIAGENLGARFDLDVGIADQRSEVALRGALLGGELLAGSAYVALPKTPVALEVQAVGDAHGWTLPRIAWDDGRTLASHGRAAFAPDGALRTLEIDLNSDDLAPVSQRYLSGWLGSVGLGDIVLHGGLRTRIHLGPAGVRGIEAIFDEVSVREGGGVFRFDGLNGELRYSADDRVDSELRWRASQLYGLDFGAAVVPLSSAGGMVELRRAVSFDAIGGQIRFDRFRLRPPVSGQGMQAGFGLSLDALDVGKLAQTLGWPAFRGTLTGSIPDARYLDDRLSFEGGLDMHIFDGSVRVSSLEMERPFGVAPTLSADLVLDDLDLLAVTEVFDFGSISGRLDGRIAGLRLVDWNATAFDAALHTERRRGVRQRISQRAVQNISSVGDPSFITSLQGQLIGLFDDFGYRRIGITCRLHNQICSMGGLESLRAGAAGSGSDTSGFTIVEGSGVPRLTVAGFNRRVDWQTLVERLAAIGQGEVKPVVD